MRKKIILGILLLLALAGGGIWWWLHSMLPQYKGEQLLSGPKAEVEVYFDQYGIPHIYAQNETDAYFALGYVVAQDRLFQLEMIRRLAAGRLSEVLGSSTLKSDRFFRTLGLNKHAEWSEKEFLSKADKQTIASAQAYANGINAFIKAGKKPFEFRLIGIDPEPYTLRDAFLITGYMAFGFAEAFRIDPMVEGIARKAGEPRLKQLELGYPADAERIPVTASANTFSMEGFPRHIDRLIASFPVAPWMGSNSWVLAPSRTKNKQTLLCNDTHMGYSQPAIWYEAHIEYPGFRHYGNYIAGLPFALVGHNDYCGNGLTMLENDDADFYIEKLEGEKVMHKGQWVPLQVRSEKILVKDEEAVIHKVAETPHGPIVQNVFEEMPSYKEEVSLFWTFLKFPSKALETTYRLNHARSMDDARQAAAMLEAPGLNFMYGDKDGNIAWWAVARFLKRPEGVFSKRFLDGATGAHEPLGFYPFSDNPKSENPASGFVYSANNQPDSCGVGLYPGYYVSGDRAQLIRSNLEARKDWDADGMKQLMTSSKSTVYAQLSKEMLAMLQTLNPNAIGTEAANRISIWEGEHGLESVGPVIFYRWLYWSLHEALIDEIGPELVQSYMGSHFMKTGYLKLMYSFDNVWWDDLRTKQPENRNVIVARAWNITIEELNSKLGKDVNNWRWKRVHTLEHKHPAGQGLILSRLLNVGPVPVPGGNEVLNNMGFDSDSTVNAEVFFGPSMRRIIDFSNVEESYSVLPTGQSGYFFAPHYQDQFELFNQNTYRRQWMRKSEITKQAGSPLRLKPAP